MQIPGPLGLACEVAATAVGRRWNGCPSGDVAAIVRPAAVVAGAAAGLGVAA